MFGQCQFNSKMEFPFDIQMIDYELNQELLNYFHGEKTGFVTVGPGKYFFPYQYKIDGQHYYNFEAREDDIWVVSFPRSGTTWTQELVWLLANDCDFVQAKSKPLTERFPFFEYTLFLHQTMEETLLKENEKNTENLEKLLRIRQPVYQLLNDVPKTQRRFIKSHFPFSLLPPSVLEKKCKVIYVKRNPKDVAVSYYHLFRLFRTLDYKGDFKRFWTYFEKSLIPWTPYFSHIREGMMHIHLSNVLLLEYEELSSNLSKSIDKVARFLNQNINQTKKLLLMDHLSIDSFRRNPMLNASESQLLGICNTNRNNFIRLGQSGVKHDEYEMVPGLAKIAEEWIQENKQKLFY